MAKRFTDTNKWKDTWFQDMPNKYKLFWIYMLDECDAAGLWKPNMRLAQFQIGEPFEEGEIKRVFADRIEITNDGYWFIRKFIDFQYGKLSTKSKPHMSVIKLLDKHNIKGYTKGIHTIKDKDKEEDKDKETADKMVISFGTGKYFVIINSQKADDDIYKLNGIDGLIEFFQMNMSIVRNKPIAEKFMRDSDGKHFNDFKHIWNALSDYTKKHFA